MGYTTDFNGEWNLDRSLTPEHKTYLEAFATTRRMKRDPDVVGTLPDPVRIAAGLPVGYEGAYFVGSPSQFGQDNDASVLDYNEPPGKPQVPPADPTDPMADWGERYAKEAELTAHALSLGLAQPGLWCQWVPDSSGTAIVWDEGEKFYEYIAWIEYLIAHFIGPWGYKLNGAMYWTGEDSDDKGLIQIKDNVVTVKYAVITYR